ncbi:hypothetical protein MMC18_002771 [Xylographa bjoerkii]|nr:hypothetical protein [Xylographa bjoerkii]
MGEGGYLALINGTPYTWRRSGRTSNQMREWQFPEEVKPVRVEFDHGAENRKATKGTCTYSLQGYTADIRIEAHDEEARLSAELKYLSAAHGLETSSIDLGWSQDGIQYFVLSGKDGNFSSSGLPSDWMQQNLRTLGARTLPRGQSMESIIDDINRFTAKNAELIIMNLSHDTQSDDDFRRYNQAEWYSLFQQLLKLNHLFVADASVKRLHDLKLTDFIGAGHAAVVIVVEPSDPLDLGEFATKGF